MTTRLRLPVLILLLTIIANLPAWGQQVPITGKITDELDKPLPGASVFVKGKSQATTSQVDGKFGMLANPKTDTLEVTFVGFETIRVPLQGRTNITIPLVARKDNLDEVVVISALGLKRTEKSVTYASQSVDPKTLTEARDLNFINGLAGKVAGLELTNTGQPGGSVRITLRGDKSMTGNSSPLIVIDGVPFDNGAGDAGNLDYGNPIANINPDDIEDITVLKGPNGAALYGSRAANGAILITMKKGKSGIDKNLGIELNQNIQFYKITQFPDYQNVYGEGGSFIFANNNNVRANGGVNMGGSSFSWGMPMLGQPYNTYAGQPLAGGYSPQPNNIRDFYKPSTTATSNFAVGKNDANGAFRLSYGFTKGNDVIDNLNLVKKHNVLFNASRTIKRFRFDTRVGYTYFNTRNRMSRGLSAENPLAMYVYTARSIPLNGFMPYRDANGNSVTTGAIGDTENPYWSIYANSNEDTRYATNGSVMATVDLGQGLKFRGQVAGDLATTENYVYRELGSKKTPNGFYSNQVSRQNNWYYEALLLYNKKIKKDFSIDAVGGFSVDNKNVLTRGAYINGLLKHEMPSIYNAVAYPFATESLGRTRVQSLFGKATFGYKTWLYLDLTARNEWGSTLPLDYNTYFYPMAGAGFVFSDLLKNKTILSYGKLRANYSKVGTSNIGPGQIINTYSSQGLFLGQPTLSYTTVLRNEQLKPEQTYSKEVGLELGFLKNRINVNATWYQNNTKNQILSVQTPVETGYTNRFINAGEIQNKGIELTLNATPIQNKSITWKSTINFAKNNSLVKSILPGVDRVQLGGRLGATVNAKVGYPYGVHLGNRPIMFGDTILVGTNGRALDVNRNVVTGIPRPKWTGGFLNTVNYKGFSLSITATVRFGGVIFSESYGRAMFQGTTVKSLEGRDDYLFSNFILGESDNERRGIGQTIGTKITRYSDSVRVKGMTYPNAYLPKMDASGVPLRDANGNYIVGNPFDGWVFPQLVLGNDKTVNDVPYLTFDATSVKISEIVFGYSLPPKVLNRTFVRGAWVAFTVRNPWQIYQKTPLGIDPESAAGTSNGNLGMESGGSFPYASWGFNLKLSF